MKNVIIIAILIGVLTSCDKDDNTNSSSFNVSEINSLNDLENTLLKINDITNTGERNTQVTALWDSLKSNNTIPFVRDDSVMFLYKGSADLVQWAGDFNGWNPTANGFTGELLDSINIWYLKKQFPTDARLDYKVVINSNNWIMDPANSNVQYSGFGPNSELRMSQWTADTITFAIDGATTGNLSDWTKIQSSQLGYKLQYKVYLPHNYASLENLPVIYVTDGQEYSDSRLGNMITVLDNLIYLESIEPIIAVFVDPRNPDNLSTNRRADQYTGKISYANFLADELKIFIDNNYKTNPSAEVTAILGTSLGGWNSTYVGFNRSDKFNLLGIHSPAYYDEGLFTKVENTDKLPLKMFMSTGVIYDTQDGARRMKSIFESKGYDFRYIEVNEGHSWGNWRALLDEPLIYFYGK